MFKRIAMILVALLLCMLCSCMATSAPEKASEGTTEGRSGAASETEALPPTAEALSPSSPQTDGSSSAPAQTDSQGASNSQDTTDAQTGTKSTKSATPTRTEISRKYDSMTPTLWGEKMKGIISRLPTKDKVVALTLDACGWGKGSGYDEKLIEFLVKENIPATLFISGKWIEDNPGKIDYLAQQENFEIENHGYAHKPLSVNGKSVYGIDGTVSPAEIYDEIMGNALKIEELTGHRPLFFRTGTAYYDDVAVKIADELGVKIAGFTISGDGGASFSANTIEQVCAAPEHGAILLFHMNHPESDTRKGIKAVYKNLKTRGYTFVKMADY